MFNTGVGKHLVAEGQTSKQNYSQATVVVFVFTLSNRARNILSKFQISRKFYLGYFFFTFCFKTHNINSNFQNFLPWPAYSQTALPKTGLITKKYKLCIFIKKKQLNVIFINLIFRTLGLTNAFDV